jgi:hypothetical protein
MQQLNTKFYVSMATVINATTEELTEAVFSVQSTPAAACLCSIGAARKGIFSWSDLRLYYGDQRDKQVS